MLKRLDLQTRSKEICQKQRPIEPTKKTPIIAIVKREEKKSRSRFFLLLERASLIFYLWPPLLFKAIDYSVWNKK